MRRRTLTLALASLALPMTSASALPARALAFPRDFGSHPEQRIEWWYVTGRLMAGVREFGFQITFFRTRIESTQGMQSAFAAKQLLFAHAAVTDVQGQKLWHDQRIAREGFGVARADLPDTGLQLRDWSMAHEGTRYRVQVAGSGFRFALTLTETQPLLLQGQQGLSRKGPDTQQASYYYSQPQLSAEGRLTLQGQALPVTGTAWLDHEWSDELLHPLAVGWDWIGMNLNDGSALTAFRLRDQAGGTLWDGGSFRRASGTPRIFQPGEVRFEPLRYWTSPLSQTRYPVEWRVTIAAQSPTPSGNSTYTVRAVIDAQELDSRASTGAIYWEGLSELIDSDGQHVGYGYLEMTGYAQPLKL
jgi:predicted secreted hydrolase